MAKGSLTLRDSYNYYKANYKDYLPYKDYCKCIKACNIELLNSVVNNADDVNLPYKLGILHIVKYRRTYSDEKFKWAVDFKKSKELGFKVYFDQKYIYKWRWEKTRTVIKERLKYKFTASRQAKRMVPKALANNVDYFNLSRK